MMITVRSTLVYDSIGNSYLLSDLTELSEAQIPYPEQVVKTFDYEQSSILRDLRMKEVLCTRSNWISHYRTIP